MDLNIIAFVTGTVCGMLFELMLYIIIKMWEENNDRYYNYFIMFHLRVFNDTRFYSGD